MKTSTFVRLAVVFMLIAVILQVGQVQGAQAAGSGPTVTKNITVAQQNAALAYWNHARLAVAQPFSMPVDTGDPAASAFALADPLSIGIPGSSPAGVAAPNAAAIAKKAYAADWKAQSSAAMVEDVVPTGTSQVYTSYVANSYAPMQTIYPHVWVGRLAFNAGYCSATAISKNNIVTAAHCVFDTTNNVWYNNWVFTPAYRAGSAPYGSFAASTCTILTAWQSLSGSFSINGWTKYDVAVCTVGKNSAGQTLNQAVGWAGRTWNAGYSNNYHDMGYPFKNTSNVSLPNAGAYLRLCTAESFAQTTDTLGMGCNWGPGISGGPWMLGYAPTVVQGAVNSVNSGMYIGTQNMYGIRFTSSNIVPICTARGC